MTLALRRQRATTPLAECLRRQEVDLWLVYTRESSRDPLAADLGRRSSASPRPI